MRFSNRVPCELSLRPALAADEAQLAVMSLLRHGAIGRLAGLCRWDQAVCSTL